MSSFFQNFEDKYKVQVPAAIKDFHLNHHFSGMVYKLVGNEHLKDCFLYPLDVINTRYSRSAFFEEELPLDANLMEAINHRMNAHNGPIVYLIIGVDVELGSYLAAKYQNGVLQGYFLIDKVHTHQQTFLFDAIEDVYGITDSSYLEKCSSATRTLELTNSPLAQSKMGDFILLLDEKNLNQLNTYSNHWAESNYYITSEELAYSWSYHKEFLQHFLSGYCTILGVEFNSESWVVSIKYQEFDSMGNKRLEVPISKDIKAFDAFLVYNKLLKALNILHKKIYLLIENTFDPEMVCLVFSDEEAIRQYLEYRVGYIWREDLQQMCDNGSFNN